MAFKKIAPFVDQIEKGFKDRKSPQAIADELGIPSLAQTIRRYKAAVWDMKDLVRESKEIRAERHEAIRSDATEEIIRTMDLIEKIKRNSYHHLDYKAGEKYNSTDGERIISPGQAVMWHLQATEMASKAAKMELELGGDDPESRKADALNSMSEEEIDKKLSKLLNIINISKPDNDK